MYITHNIPHLYSESISANKKDNILIVCYWRHLISSHNFWMCCLFHNSELLGGQVLSVSWFRKKYQLWLLGLTYQLLAWWVSSALRYIYSHQSTSGHQHFTVYSKEWTNGVVVVVLLNINSWVLSGKIIIKHILKHDLVTVCLLSDLHRTHHTSL